MRSLLLLLILVPMLAHAQPVQVPQYVINHITLPAEMDKQVCISGMKFLDGKLYYASERCPEIIVSDTQGKILNTIHTIIPQEFEMEGMTSYNNKLYLVSENAVSVYEIDAGGNGRAVSTSIALPPKTKSGDGLEGIAGNEVHRKFYLLRERRDDMKFAQLYTFAVIETGGTVSLNYESMIELPLENPQWRYSDICFDKENNRLLCLKSFSKGKTRQQFIESIDIDGEGRLLLNSVKNVQVENFSSISIEYKEQDYSMNLEGITTDEAGNIYVVSDNTSGKAQCESPAKEKTILLLLKKQLN
jgi:uncharacterized protein YjiK